MNNVLKSQIHRVSHQQNEEVFHENEFQQSANKQKNHFYIHFCGNSGLLWKVQDT